MKRFNFRRDKQSDPLASDNKELSVVNRNFTPFPSKFISIFDLPDKKKLLLECRRNDLLLYAELIFSSGYISEVEVINSNSFDFSQSVLFYRVFTKLNNSQYQMAVKYRDVGANTKVAKIAPSNLIDYFELEELYSSIPNSKLICSSVPLTITDASVEVCFRVGTRNESPTPSFDI